MPQTLTQPVQGPDGQLYQFPAGTTKDQAISYFRSKGIGAGPGRGGAPAQPAPAGPSAPATNAFPLPQGMGGDFRRLTLGDKVKQQLQSMKETLPAIGAGTAVALTPATGGTSDLFLPVLAALIGGSTGNSLKDVVSKGIGSKDAPASMGQALSGDAEEGIKQGLYQTLGMGAEGFLERRAASSAARAAQQPTNNLVSMIGASYEPRDSVEGAWPALKATMQKMNYAPQDPEGWINVTQQAKKDIDAKFASYLWSRRGTNPPLYAQKVVPQDIRSRILGLITPDMPNTPAGREEIKAIQVAASSFEKPWTYGALNSMRSRLNMVLTPVFNKGTNTIEFATALSPIQKSILMAERDGSANYVYDAINKINPGADVEDMKRTEGSLIRLQSDLKNSLTDIRNKGSAMRGRTVRESLAPSLYVSDTGKPHGYVRGMANMIPGGGPEEIAATKAARASKGALDKVPNVPRGLSTPPSIAAALRSYDAMKAAEDKAREQQPPSKDDVYEF